MSPAGVYQLSRGRLTFWGRRRSVNQGGNGNPLGAITHQYERTQVWGTSFFGARRVQRHDLLIGGDGYRERMASPAFTFDVLRGTTAESRPRVPDGARYVTYGLYLQDSWDALGNGRLRLSGAVRFGGASYNARAPVSRLWPNDSLAVNNVTGRLGAVVRVSDPWRIHTHYSRGFRAPSVTDLGTVGLQGNGAFEAAYIDLAGRGRRSAIAPTIARFRRARPLAASGPNTAIILTWASSSGRVARDSN